MPTLLQSVTLAAKNMKAIALASVLALISNTGAQAAPATSPPAKARTIKIKVNPRTINNIPNFPLSTFKTSLSPKLYKSLSVSDVAAWIVVHIPPYGGEPKIIHSEAGGVFDKLALSMAKGWGSVGYNTTESRTHQPSLDVHLLIYKIADGIMAVNFSHNDDAFHAGRQYTDAWVGVLKDGKWTRVGGTKFLRESVIEHSIY
jgi:hypothetical protein